MFENRKIKKAIKKHRKPNKSFEEFCARQDLHSDCDIVQGNTKVKANVFGLSMGIISVSVCLFAVIALSLFMPNNKSSPLPEIKYYGVDMVKEEKISFDEFMTTGISTLIDFNKVEQYGVVTLVMPSDEEDIVLGYSIYSILYGFWNDEQLFAFELSLTIRCYEGYLFTGHDYFDDPQYAYNENCKFRISINNEEAYISVVNEDYEYFITVKEYGGITSVNKESIELLIQDIL